jgi:hypothetical protein
VSDETLNEAPALNEQDVQPAMGIVTALPHEYATDGLISSDDPGEVITHPNDPRRLKGIPRVFLGPIASSNTLPDDQPFTQSQVRRSLPSPRQYGHSARSTIQVMQSVELGLDYLVALAHELLQAFSIKDGNYPARVADKLGRLQNDRRLANP